MSKIFDLKTQLLLKIAALKAVTVNIETGTSFSFPSLNGNNNSLDFLLDLVKITLGYDKLRSELQKFLIYNIPSFESQIKNDLLLFLKSLFFCNIDAPVPPILIHNLGDGYTVALTQIDFFSILKVNPTSIEGQLIYGSNSDDLNYTLYNAIQSGVSVWKNLLVFEYTQTGFVEGVARPHVLRISIHEDWSGTTINDFMNALFNSVTLYDLPSLMTNLLDTIFSTVSSLRNISETDAFNNAIFERLVNKIVDAPDTVLDNSYYEFTQDELFSLEERRRQIQMGYTNASTCGFVPTQITYENLLDFYESLNASSTKVEIKTVFDNKFEVLVAEGVANLGEQDKQFGLLSLFSSLFRGVILSLTSAILSPKTMVIILTYFKIVNSSINFNNFEQFLKNYQKMLENIIKNTILPKILVYLFELVADELANIVVQDRKRQLLEQNKKTLLAQLSLVGIPEEVRSLILRFIK